MFKTNARAATSPLPRHVGSFVGGVSKTRPFIDPVDT